MHIFAYHNLPLNTYHFQGNSLYILGMKKLQRLSVRTTKQNEDYLRQLMTDNKRSMSYLVDLMIDAFRVKGVTDERDIK